MENNKVKILWDFPIQTDKQAMANQPDVIVIYKNEWS